MYCNSTMCCAKNCISRNAILAETIENFESCRATSRCPPHLSLSLYPEYVRYHMYAESYTSGSTLLQIYITHIHILERHSATRKFGTRVISGGHAYYALV